MHKVLLSLALIVCILSDASLVIGHAQGAEAKPGVVPPLLDLGHDGEISRLEKKPVILFFSLPDCSYCKVVRQNYLSPLLRNHVVKDRPLIREVDMMSLKEVKNADHRLTTQRDVAKRFNIVAAPTVLFIDGNGNALTAPIVGGDIAGLYGGYLDNAFAESARKLAGVPDNKREPNP